MRGRNVSVKIRCTSRVAGSVICQRAGDSTRGHAQARQIGEDESGCNASVGVGDVGAITVRRADGDKIVGGNGWRIGQLSVVQTRRAGEIV